MTTALDDEVRSIAIAQVQRLVARYGGRIPRSELSAGITVRGERVPIWNYQKGIFKPAMLGRDGAALSIQTSAESPYEDEHNEGAGHFVYKYRGTDPSHPDNAALRRAMIERVPLIYLVAVDVGVYDAIVPIYVTSDDPSRHQVTLVADQIGVEVSSVVEPITALRREYTTRAVMQRLHQVHFRRMVLKAYRNQCSICRLRHVDLLDAAHILADRHPRGEPVVSNGLGLCKIHHSAFDANILGIDPDARVHIRADIMREHDGPMLKHGLQELDGAHLIVPARAELRPNREFLEERFNEFRAA